MKEANGKQLALFETKEAVCGLLFHNNKILSVSRKSNHNDFNLFDWIKQYLEQDGYKTFMGYSLYEEAIEPTLYYLEGKRNEPRY